jgi:hypothetical protein
MQHNINAKYLCHVVDYVCFFRGCGPFHIAIPLPLWAIAMKIFTLKHIYIGTQRFILDQNDLICGVRDNHGRIYGIPNSRWNFWIFSWFIIISEYTKVCGTEWTLVEFEVLTAVIM